MKVINVEKLWDELNSYPEVGKLQKEEQLVYYTIHYAPQTQFGSIRETLNNISESTLNGCIEELNTMPTMDGDDIEEPIDDDFRYYLHGNMFHEIQRLDNVYSHIWNAAPQAKKKKRAFF